MNFKKDSETARAVRHPVLFVLINAVPKKKARSWVEINRLARRRREKPDALLLLQGLTAGAKALCWFRKQTGHGENAA